MILEFIYRKIRPKIAFTAYLNDNKILLNRDM